MQAKLDAVAPHSAFPWAAARFKGECPRSSKTEAWGLLHGSGSYFRCFYQIQFRAHSVAATHSLASDVLAIRSLASCPRSCWHELSRALEQSRQFDAHEFPVQAQRANDQKFLDSAANRENIEVGAQSAEPGSLFESSMPKQNLHDPQDPQ